MDHGRDSTCKASSNFAIKKLISRNRMIKIFGDYANGM
jgi:hypothetical protein